MSEPSKPTVEPNAEVSSGSPVIQADSKLSLDALLSPHPTKETLDPHPGETPPETATEPAFREVALDDDSHFSTVPLTARQSTASMGSNGAQSDEATFSPTGKESSRKEVVSIAASDSSTHALHRRSVSRERPESITGNAPFILARLEGQKGQDEAGTPGKRFSVDGQVKLQEEFVRIQHDIKEEDETEAAALALTIDWGMSTSMFL